MNSTTRVARFFAGLVALVFATAAYATEDFPIPSFRATYRLKVSGLAVGKLERVFEIDERGQFSFFSSTKSSGLAALLRKHRTDESSRGYAVDKRLIPDTYTYSRVKGDSVKTVELTFDFAANTLVANKNETLTRRDLVAESTDKLTYQVQMMADLKAERRGLSYVVEDTSKTRSYTPALGPEQTIKTPHGEYVTLPVIQAKPNDKRRTTFWCAPALDFLPVQVSHIDKSGRETTATLLEFERGPSR